MNSCICICPTCGIEIEYDPHHASQVLSCPTCANQFTAPAPDPEHDVLNSSLSPGERAGVRGGWLKLLLAAVLLGSLYLIDPFLLVLLAGAAIYFLPSLLAWRRHHRNAAAIFILNFLLGWTLLGWAAALVWSIYREKQ